MAKHLVERPELALEVGPPQGLLDDGELGDDAVPARGRPAVLPAAPTAWPSVAIAASAIAPTAAARTATAWTLWNVCAHSPALV